MEQLTSYLISLNQQAKEEKYKVLIIGMKLVQLFKELSGIYYDLLKEDYSEIVVTEKLKMINYFANSLKHLVSGDNQ